MRFTKAQLSDLQNEIRELTSSNDIEVIVGETKVLFGADDMVKSLTLTLKVNGKKETKTILPSDKWHKDMYKGDIAQKADELGLIVGNYKLKHWYIGYKSQYAYGIHETIYCFKKQDADFTAKESEMVGFIKNIAQDIFTESLNDAIGFGIAV